jgi:serine/threonine-protein kinase
VLAGRYRIVALLGRGGMGEVYRADDLKLEQPVALKFLSRLLEGDPERLARLYDEVRAARQVSHPAVCRVWDVGEADGAHFLSMELVDGENLASLLRRIGRFPQDKARDVARQVAEGLAAVHAKGLLHRDLKPANVMLDGQGHARLTDFGLAGYAEGASGDIRSGTPSYMSPEQLAGREVSVRSDVYALGLLIYELVTGRRAVEGKGLAELSRKHREERPIEPSRLVPDLDPALERTILACLEKEPRQRPPSALAVAAMLAGRDRLQAAIAAGDTPSPELVAAAGEADGLKPRVARACVAAVIVGVLAFPALNATRHPLVLTRPEKNPATLEDRARELLARLGAASPVDSETGFRFDVDYVRWVREHDRSRTRWGGLALGEPPLVELWYRQGPRPLTAANLAGLVGPDDPPTRTAGMAGARYDLRGRLTACYVVPPELERTAADAKPSTEAGAADAGSGAGPPREPDWHLLFTEARLDAARLRRVEPAWTPPFYADTRAAWEGHWPSRPEIPLRVEAAGYAGRPVWFEIKSSWTRPTREPGFSPAPSQRELQVAYVLILLALIAVGAVLGLRNLAQGRGDRRGAFRLALAIAALGVAAWALRAHHVADPIGELASCARGLGLAVLVAALLWVLYLALEPQVRRLRPWTLVSWTRLIGGGWRDAVVGRDVLIGMTFGIGVVLLHLLSRALPVFLGQAAPEPQPLGLDFLLSTRRLLSFVVFLPASATFVGLGLLLLFLVLRLLTRRDWIAALLVVSFLIVGDMAEQDSGVEHESGAALWVVLPIVAVVWSAYTVLLLRFGVLAAIAAVFTADMLLGPSPIYAGEAWTGTTAFVVLPFLLGLAWTAYQTATGAAKQRLAGAGTGPPTG